MAVKLRSGKEVSSNNRVENKEKTDQEEDKAIGRDDEKIMSERTTKEEKKKQTEQPEKSCGEKQKEKVQAYTLVVPLLQRLQKAKKEEQFSKFLEIFKKIEINIPFAEAINQMPNYAKFLKEILSKKKKIAEEAVVNLTATYSAVIQRCLPTKMKDPHSFTIPYSIGKYEFKKALCDSRANINLMPLLVVQRLSLGELTTTTIILVTPQTRGSVDYPSTRGIQVEVGLPDATFRKSGRVSFVRGALPKYKTCISCPNSAI